MRLSSGLCLITLSAWFTLNLVDTEVLVENQITIFIPGILLRRIPQGIRGRAYIPFTTPHRSSDPSGPVLEMAHARRRPLFPEKSTTPRTV
jgi:hypothetical protein